MFLSVKPSAPQVRTTGAVPAKVGAQCCARDITRRAPRAALRAALVTAGTSYVQRVHVPVHTLARGVQRCSAARIATGDGV